MSDEVENYKDAQQEGEGDQEKALIPIQVGQIDFYGDVLQVVLVEINGERLVLVPLRQFCQHLVQADTKAFRVEQQRLTREQAER